MAAGQKFSAPLDNGLNLIYSKWVTMYKNNHNYTHLCNDEPFKVTPMLAVHKGTSAVGVMFAFVGNLCRKCFL